MKKTPDYLKIINNNSKEDKNKKEVEQLAFFDNAEKTDDFLYDTDELNYLLGLFDEILAKTLKNNTVRNTKDLDNLHQALQVYINKTIKPLHPGSNNLILWMLVLNLIKRLSKINFKIKKPPYEELLLYDLLEIYDLELDKEPRSSVEEFINLMSKDNDLFKISTDWLIPLGSFVAYIFDFNYEISNIILFLIIRKIIKEGYRKETGNTIDNIAFIFDSYLKSSVALGIPYKQINNFIEPNSLEFGFSAVYIDYLISENKVKQIYHMILDISKKGKLKKFYDKLSPAENNHLIESIFSYLYYCLCLNYFDYFENIFPIFAKLTNNKEYFYTLITLYQAYAPKKRIERFIRKCYEPDSKLSNRTKRIISNIIL